MFGCKVGSFPTSYIGLPLGGNLRAALFWNPIFEKIWKSLVVLMKGFFSKVGRVTLIRSVLAAFVFTTCPCFGSQV